MEKMSAAASNSVHIATYICYLYYRSLEYNFKYLSGFNPLDRGTLSTLADQLTRALTAVLARST